MTVQGIGRGYNICISENTDLTEGSAKKNCKCINK